MPSVLTNLAPLLFQMLRLVSFAFFVAIETVSRLYGLTRNAGVNVAAAAILFPDSVRESWSTRWLVLFRQRITRQRAAFVARYAKTISVLIVLGVGDEKSRATVVLPGKFYPRAIFAHFTFSFYQISLDKNCPFYVDPVMIDGKTRNGK